VTTLPGPGIGVGTLRSVTSGPGRLSVGELAERWGQISRMGARKRLERAGLLDDAHRSSKGGYSFSIAEIEALEADPDWVSLNRGRRPRRQSEEPPGDDGQPA
jgi:hypothetical protein